MTQKQSIHKICLLAIIGILAFSSCVPQKKMLLLKEMEMANENTSIEYQNERTLDYKIQPGDNLYIKAISIIDEKSSVVLNGGDSRSGSYLSSDASIYLNSYTVSKDGYIDYPLTGLVEVRNLTVEQAKERLQDSLSYDKKLAIADKLVYSKIRENIGAENFDIIVSGAAAISQEVAGFFSAIKMPVFEGYGLTETSPVIAVSNRNPHGREVGYVGQPLPGTEVKIAENGEICCRGHNVMMGYYKHPELTKEVIDDEGWFHTGDMGEIDQYNRLRITGRIKSLFKTSGGKYINPDVIEAKFCASKLIENILVVGENQKFAGALIIPSFSDLKAWCAEEKIPYTTNEEMIQNADVLKRFAKEVNELNKGLGETEKIKKQVLLADEWSIANGLLTPTLKAKRKVITAKYKDVIEKMFA